ncbi:hypothetical protein PGT21_013330 [Puccinia graminis f. sp. tritici]|uniref:Uncharacterized protein n=1 Tax=Puccinia graminis f. sp. tritici TaxID=56615 RepID=A0A5B0QW65_PUCGR|nr:hypothetical protein PGT21_013330 [Puccinia graminis f. sp. tritici]
MNQTDDADSRAPSHATRSATWEPSSPEAHHQSPIAAPLNEPPLSHLLKHVTHARNEPPLSYLLKHLTHARNEPPLSHLLKHPDSRSEQTASQPPSEASDSRPAEAASEGHHSKSSVNVSREAQSYSKRENPDKESPVTFLRDQEVRSGSSCR